MYSSSPFIWGNCWLWPWFRLRYGWLWPCCCCLLSLIEAVHSLKMNMQIRTSLYPSFSMGAWTWLVRWSCVNSCSDIFCWLSTWEPCETRNFSTSAYFFWLGCYLTTTECMAFLWSRVKSLRKREIWQSFCIPTYLNCCMLNFLGIPRTWSLMYSQEGGVGVWGVWTVWGGSKGFYWGTTKSNVYSILFSLGYICPCMVLSYVAHP